MRWIRHSVFRWALSIVLLVLMALRLWLKREEIANVTITWAIGWYLLLVVLLMPVNWWLEAKKWLVLLSVHANVRSRDAYRAVTGGIALSLFTPNRIGEYGGRILFLPHAIRWPVVFSTLMGSISQNLVAFGAGILAFIVLFDGLMTFKMVGAALLLLGLFCLFKIRMAVQWVCSLRLHKAFQRLTGQLHYLENYSAWIKMKALGLALARYLVYTFQFVILLKAFEPTASLSGLWLGVGCLYLFHTLVPLPPVADVLARTNLALILWSGTGMSELSISAASFIVWVINLLIPAVYGSIAISTVNPKKSFSTHDTTLHPAYEPVVADRTGAP